MNLKNLLQSVDPIRRESGQIDAQRIRNRVVQAAHHVDDRPAVSARRAAVVAAAALIIAAVLVGTQMLSHAAVRFEVRLAEEQPAAGLTAVRVAPNRTVYLHPEVVVTNADIAFSNVIPGNAPAQQFWIDVRLNAAGADKMRRATMNHLGRPVAILIDGEVVSVPTVKSPIGAAAVISGDFTRADAERIAQGMNIN